MLNVAQRRAVGFSFIQPVNDKRAIARNKMCFILLLSKVSLKGFAKVVIVLIICLFLKRLFKYLPVL